MLLSANRRNEFCSFSVKFMELFMAILPLSCAEFFSGSIQKSVGLEKIRYLTKRLKVSNQKLKTIRRKSYGLPDEEYFFLKLFDASRQRWRSLEDD